MSVYRRIYCRKCKKDFELRKEVASVECRYCNVEIKLNNKNSVYYIEYRFDYKRMREKVGFNRKFAEMVLSKRLIEIAENKFLDVKIEKKVKFEVLAKEYYSKHLKLNCSSEWARKERVNVEHLIKHFRDCCLEEVIPLKIEQFKQMRLKEVSPSTVNKGLACLKAMMNKAIDWNMFEGINPVMKVKYLKVDNRRLRYLEKDEIAILLSNCPPYLKSIITIALNTGMRKGEIFNLKWEDLNFKLRMINLLKTKNNEQRHIPMNQAVYDTLIYLKKYSNGRFIFDGVDGNPITDVKHSFTTTLRKSGIKDFRFHDLRHTFASQLVMSGVDLNTVRELLGHKDIKMTLRYSHLSGEHKMKAVQALDGIVNK